MPPWIWIPSLASSRAQSPAAALALATSTAKVAAGDCERLLSKEGIQIHGGIGYTWEHDMHLYVRRAKTNSLLLGTAADHRARIADLLEI